MARKRKADRVLFLTACGLLCAGVVMVYSASAVLALERYGQPLFYLVKQGAGALVGLVLLSVLMHVDYQTWRQRSVVLGGLGAVAVLLVATLVSPAINGAHRWLVVGGVTFQPSEIAKVIAIIFTAFWLDRNMDRIDDRRCLLPIGLVVGGLALLILRQPDLGTAFTLVLIVAVMVFSAGLRYRYLIGAAALALPLLAYELLTKEYRMRRLFSWLDPWEDPTGDGFQLLQSLIAVGSGGWLGQGLMGGDQKKFFLPEPHTDFIYAVIAEELGFVGATIVVLAFCVIAWRGLAIAARAEDRFGAFLAIGLTAMIAFQALVNLSVVVGVLPTKGIPLPLVSAGVSSLLTSLIGVGILLNVSQHASDPT